MSQRKASASPPQCRASFCLSPISVKAEHGPAAARAALASSSQSGSYDGERTSMMLLSRAPC